MSVPAESSPEGMSQEQRMGLVRAIFASATRHDLEGYLALVAEDAEFDFSQVERPYAGIYRGHEEIARLYHHLDDPWREKVFELEDPVAVLSGVVLDVTRRSRTATGFAVQTTATALISFRGAKIIAMKMFRTREDALRATAAAA